MSVDFQDIRALVLSGGVKARQEAIYVERLGGWLNIRELMANEKSQVMQEAVNQKTGVVDLDKLNAGIAVRSLRYPSPGVTPKEPVAPTLPTAPAPLADDANDVAKQEYAAALKEYDDEMEAYTKAKKAYSDLLATWEKYRASYPGYTDEAGNVATFPHPKAGERIFKPTERDAFSAALPGGVLEEVATPAFTLSGFNRDDVKKTGSATTPVSSMTTPSPTSSSVQTLSAS